MPKKKPPHRPSLSKSGPTTSRNIKVPDEQWERWKRAAEREGKTLSEWIRTVVDRAAKRVLK